jgi:hypothetical protein
MALESLSLPATVTSIGETAFASGCALKTIRVNAVTPPVVDVNLSTGLFMSDPYTIIESIYVPAGSVDAYKNAPGWSEYAALIRAIE